MTAQENWVNSLDAQIEFHTRAGEQRRKDNDFDWSWCEGATQTFVGRARHAVGKAARAIGVLPMATFSRAWFRLNSEVLWEARCLLEDELSRRLFDAVNVLRACGHRRYYFPRTEHDDLLLVKSDTPFAHEGLPADYVGLPLRVVDVVVSGRPDVPRMRMITTRLQLDALNKYRQYVIRRDGLEFSPRRGEVVIDCGACIGEVSLLFSGLVGTEGQVHLFDPVPLHARYCRLQAQNNEALAAVMQINSLAVGKRTTDNRGGRADVQTITPGALTIDSFSTTTLDDYAKARVARVDFIKMDIEGAEMDALDGASECIREFKPRLAISAYHRPDEFWTIPRRIKDLYPGCRLYFGHHTPSGGESVYYAIDRCTPGA